MELPKQYEPKEAEPRWQRHWEEKKTYAHEPAEGSITIDTPPPTVSGSMHIGHASSYAQEDFYARYYRMKTGKVFYPFGTDDNGLPTEKLVEKLKGVKATKMSRKEFRELCHTTIEQLKPAFIEDWKRIGMSCDFSTTYSTISEHSIATSQKSFLDLYKKGRVYREESPVAWCVQCQTAIAQADFDNVEMSSSFNDVIFKCGGKDLVIATTRPELIPACVAIAAHPADERYKDLHGKFVTVPITQHEVPVIFDESVAQEKGTGLLMVCTFGDKEDIEKWRVHKLELRAIVTRDGKLNELAGAYAAMPIRDARKQILEDLKKDGTCIRSQQITHAVNVHERCGTEIEFLKTAQWYIRILDEKEALIDAGKKIAWHPPFMQKRYEHWVENLNWDWCISRQRHFGVPFPLWHDPKTGEIVLADESELPVDPFESPRDGLVPEQDVMDTWATSSVTPQITLDWLRHPAKAEARLPMTLRPQAHDIIRTWAFYTIVKTHFHHGTIPWEHVAISGYVTDPHGQKMSKSKGNVVSPKDVLEKYSADAIRFWAASAKLGDDIPYQEKELVTGKKTVTKLWNASRFALSHLEEYDGTMPDDLLPIDRWLLARLNETIHDCTKSFESYDHSRAKFLIDQFFWNVLCDNYLELVKGRLYEPKNEGEKRSAQYALLTTLEAVCKLFAPFLPFITEELYRYLPVKNKDESIHTSRWPTTNDAWEDSAMRALGDEIVLIIEAVRKHKSEQQLSMNAEIGTLRITSKNDVRAAERDLVAVTKAATLAWEEGEFAVEIN